MTPRCQRNHSTRQRNDAAYQRNHSARQRNASECLRNDCERQKRMAPMLSKWSAVLKDRPNASSKRLRVIELGRRVITVVLRFINVDVAVHNVDAPSRSHEAPTPKGTIARRFGRTPRRTDAALSDSRAGCLDLLVVVRVCLRPLASAQGPYSRSLHYIL